MSALTWDEIDQVKRIVEWEGNANELRRCLTYILETWRLQDPESRDWTVESPTPEEYVKAHDHFRVCLNDDATESTSHHDDPDIERAVFRAILVWWEKQ